MQSGWLRASSRALARARPRCGPLHTNTAADVETLTAGEWNQARVEIFPFAHAFRAGSKIRVIIDAPGGNRPRWTFDALTAPDGTKVRSAAAAITRRGSCCRSSPGSTVPPGLPLCPSLRGQPCRTYTAL